MSNVCEYARHAEQHLKKKNKKIQWVFAAESDVTTFVLTDTKDGGGGRGTERG